MRLRTIAGGAAGGGAIGVFSGTATITGSTFSGNQTEGSGGAIKVNGGTVEIRQSTISGNTAGLGGAFGFGGGVSHDGGTMTIRHSTISGNTAYSGGGVINYSAQGMLIENTTISGNSETGFTGGGIFNNGPLTIRNSTITNNISDHCGGVFSRYITTAELVIQNSIIAGNRQPNGTPTDLRGITPTISHSLVGVNTDTSLTPSPTPDTNGNLIGSSTPIDPKLGPLALNGGPTQTHALVTGSPAIDRGNNTLLNGLTTDQRGNPVARIANTTVDMGAYELFTVANPIVVSTTADELDANTGTGDLSLREAIVLANCSPGANTITFAASTNSAEFDLTLGQMEISETVFITGNGASNTIIDAQQNSRIFEITGTAGDVTLIGLTLKNGRTTGNDTTFNGGAVRSLSSGTLTISQSTLSGNSTTGRFAHGGAIRTSSGAVTITQSTLSGNSTAGYGACGGAIFTDPGAVTISQSTLSGNSTTGLRAYGGAIFGHSGTVTISQSTLSGNSTTGTISNGGAIRTSSGAVTISQSTLSGNQVTGANSDGGGVWFDEAVVTIVNSTITGNSATRGGGLAMRANGNDKKLTIHNSIIAGNTAGSNPDFTAPTNPATNLEVRSSLIGRNNGTGLTATSGSTPDASGNFIGGDTDGTKVNPNLGPLASNGGPTQTHALLTGSLAIDRGSNTAAVDVTNANAPLLSDQRGVPFTRILDGDHLGAAPAATVDIGAFEFSGIRLLNPNPNAFTLRPTFTWTPIAGATSYNIQINNESTNVAPFHLASSNVASYTPPADLAIGKFKMWIRPIFGVTLGNWSAPQLFNDLTAPTWQAMQRTQLTSRPTLNWNALPGAVKYDLWMDNFSTGQKQLIRQDVTGTSFTPVTDLPMGLYRFWIRGVDAKGNFAQWSVLQEFLVVPGPTPVGPLNATFDRTPTFSWNPVAGAVSYELFVRNTNTGTNVINGTSVTGTSFTPTTNLTDGSYRWWTFAVSPVFGTGATASAIKSGGSNPVDLHVGGRTTITSPANGSSTADRTPTFTWRAVDGAVRYELLVNRINVTQAGIINQTSLTTTSFTPATDLPAGTYRAWVRAVSATNESIWSVQVDFTVTENEPADHVPEFDDQLAVMLVSLLDEDPVERDRNAEVKGQEANCDRRGFRDGDQESADLLIAHQSIESGEVDRLMMTLDIFEFDFEKHHDIVDRGSEKVLGTDRNKSKSARFHSEG